MVFGRFEEAEVVAFIAVNGETFFHDSDDLSI